MIDFHILGPVLVRDGADEITVSTPKRRALLALLVLHHGRLVPTDVLVEELWGDRPPAQAASSLQAHVSHLRRALGGDAPPIVSQSAGYLLRVDPAHVDLVRFEQSAEAGRAAAARGDHRAAADELRAALALWRGRPFDDLPGFAFAERAAESLTETYLGVLRDRLDADLALGRHLEVVAELSTLAEQHPFDERLAGQLLVALYRSGRQADALRAYRRTRQALVDELGIEPGPALVALERAILSQDESLLVPVAPAPSTAATRPAEGAPAVEPPDRPTGTVTFVFTDIERSTFLWDRHPETMADALRRHDTLLFDTISEHHGLVFSHGGDGVGAVFGRCVDALDAALDIQQRVAAADWGDIGPLRVRVALHTGEAEERESNYFGPTLNRTSRLRDAGHGGQILVSATTRDLLVEAGVESPGDGAAGAAGPTPVGFIDLGSWLFAGVSRPERVYQVSHPSLASSFPALRSGRSEAGALPQRATSFVGRDDECAALAVLLDRASLVTLIGDGGIGKTRLAIEVGRDAMARLPDGVWFCDLSAVTDEVSLEEQVAACLGVAQGAGPDLRRELVTSLRSARLLLVIDNCEHVVGPVAELVGEILAESTAKVLATSRSPLRVDGERLFPVRPLGLPDPDRPGGTPSPAVVLLAERARAVGAVVRDGDPALREIAVRLDGIPLALELAAPRLTAMTATALAARLDHRFDLLGGSRQSGPERHRTLRAAVDWSFALLTPSGRDLFAALSVCAGGFTLDAAEALAPTISLAPPSVALVLAHLVDLSMVQLDVAPDGSGRYSMLETMRAYGRDQLDGTDRRGDVLAGHAAFYLGIAEHAARQRRGAHEAAGVAAVDREFDNIRVAFRTSVEAGRLDVALRLLHALIDDAIMRKRQEVGRWAEELIAQPALEAERDRALAYAVAGNAAMVEGRLAEAVERSRAAVALEHLSTDEEDPAITTWVARNTLALLSAAGVIDDDWRGHLDAMVRLSGPAGAHADPMGAAVALFDRALIRSLTSHPERGRPAADELLDLADKHDNPTMRAMGLLSLARVTGAEDPVGAAATLYEALDLAASVGNALLTNEITRALAEGEARHGDRAHALATLRGVLVQFDRIGDVHQQLRTVLGMLDSLLAMDALPLAAMICGGLSRTPWGLTAPCRVVDRVVAERLGPTDYAALHADGARRGPAELIAFAMTEVERLVDEASSDLASPA